MLWPPDGWKLYWRWKAEWRYGFLRVVGVLLVEPGDCVAGWELRLTQASFSSVHLLSHLRLFATLWTAARQASLSITNFRSLLKLMSIQSVMPSNHLILCHPLLFPSSIFLGIRVFSGEPVLHIKWPKYWSFSFNISPSNEYSGLISFGMEWLDLFAVQGTLKLRAGALGWPRGMGWGESWEGGSGWGTHVHPWWIQVNVWQNQYSVVK